MPVDPPASRDTNTLSADQGNDEERAVTPVTTELKGKEVAVAVDSGTDMDISEASASSDMDFGNSDDEMMPQPNPRAVGPSLMQVRASRPPYSDGADTASFSLAPSTLASDTA